MLPAYAPSIYKLSWTTRAATSKLLIQKEVKKTLSHRNSPTERCLSTSIKEKIDDEVTENLNSDPAFRSTIKMPVLFYLKQLSNYCWTGYLGGKNIVPVFLGWVGEVGIREKLKQWLGPTQVTPWPAVLGIREMPWGARHCTEVHAKSHMLTPYVFWVGFSSSFPHSIIYLTLWPLKHAPLPLDESASALA